MLCYYSRNNLNKKYYLNVMKLKSGSNLSSMELFWSSVMPPNGSNHWESVFLEQTNYRGKAKYLGIDRTLALSETKRTFGHSLSKTSAKVLPNLILNSSCWTSKIHFGNQKN